MSIKQLILLFILGISINVCSGKGNIFDLERTINEIEESELKSLEAGGADVLAEYIFFRYPESHTFGVAGFDDFLTTKLKVEYDDTPNVWESCIKLYYGYAGLIIPGRGLVSQAIQKGLIYSSVLEATVDSTGYSSIYQLKKPPTPTQLLTSLSEKTKAAWCLGTIYTGHAVGLVVGLLGQSVTSYVQGPEANEVKACAACYISSLAARASLEVEQTLAPVISDFANILAFPADLKAPLCGFTSKPKRGGYVAKYIEEELFEYFQPKVSECPYQKKESRDLLVHLAGHNNFLQTSHMIGVESIRFLKNKFWDKLITDAVAVNKLSSVAVVSGWTAE